MRSYEQYCPIAVALDLVGDRWTLLVLRELFSGDKRFSDLTRGLPGIAPTVLTDRLRALESHQLVERLELPPPAARTVYRATPAADPLRGVLGRLARFGLDHLPDDVPTGSLPSHGAAWAVLAPWFRPYELDGQPRTWQLVVDGENHRLHFDGKHLTATADPAPGGVTFELAIRAESLLAIRRHQTSLSVCLADGAATTTATAPQLAELCRAFELDH
jgi:DNA-binding HxlR family transcriptional regulator